MVDGFCMAPQASYMNDQRYYYEGVNFERGILFIEIKPNLGIGKRA